MFPPPASPIEIAAAPCPGGRSGRGALGNPSVELTAVVVSGVAVLLVTRASVSGDSGSLSPWLLVTALVAYAVLGRALVRIIGRYRLARPVDVIVEALLFGVAVAVVLEVVMEWSAVDELASGRAGAYLPSVLVGLDAALVAVVARASVSLHVHRLPLVVVGGATAALFTGHLVTAVRPVEGGAAGSFAIGAVAVALVTVGVGSFHLAMSDRPDVMPVESPLFSAGHATIMVTALLAGPVVLTIDVVWDVALSDAVSLGSGVIGIVLAFHVVGLLRERASNQHLATHDLLTGLPNRLLFTDRLERALAHAERNGAPVGVLYVDLDRFKDVNDTLGHGGGDLLLREVAHRLVASARHEDTVARLAGDEFAVMLPHIASADDVMTVAVRMFEALQEPVTIDGLRVRSGGSIGVATSPADGRTPDELLNAADAAMYRAKQRTGPRVEMFSAERHRHALKRLEMEMALHDAIAAEDLVLLYQPIVDATDGSTCGAEALVRWNHRDLGLLAPDVFIPIAEESDLIVELGDWVIRTACDELARTARLGCRHFISVNVSPRQFRSDVVSSVASALRDSGADASRLVVELTEGTAVEDVQLVAHRLRELRKLGVRSAIDDFGTGYCGLQYLGDLPVSTVKLDRSFVQKMTPRSAAIVAATIAMAHSLGLVLVAEGVENEQQQRFLERNGCDRLQGFHLGRPMPADDLVDRLRAEATDRQRGAAPTGSDRTISVGGPMSASREASRARQRARSL